MKTGIWLLVFVVALAAALCWKAVHDALGNEMAAVWRDQRFRDPQISFEEAVKWLRKNQRLRQSRPTDFEPDVAGAVQAEMEAWRRQFEKGDADRTSRLALQRLSEQQLKQSVREALLDEAWLEQQLHEKAAPITESEARAWYAGHAESLRIPATLRVAHVFLSRHDLKNPDRQTEIRALHQKLVNGGASFAQVAALHSEDSRSKVRGGDLGWVTATRMPADFMQAVENLRQGKISDPVETKLGWHLIRVDERRASRLPEFEEVRIEIIAMLDQQQREKALEQISDEGME